MRAWQFSATTGGLENNLKLDDFPDIKPESLNKDEIIVKVLAAGLNPADYKVPEMGRLVRAMIGMLAIPGSDYAGRVVAMHPAYDGLKEGQLVFGRLEQLVRIGTLGEYTVANLKGVVPIPEGVGIDQAAALGTAALTSHQAIVPYIKSGQKVFINGGSGGIGTFAIQIAKAIGAEVTTTCSTGNIELVKRLGADEVVDYKSIDLLEWLSEQGQVFGHVVDNIGDTKLYHCADKYMKPAAKYIQVGLPAQGNNVLNIATSTLLPSFLGDGKRPYKFLMLSNNLPEGFKELVDWVKEGKLTPIIEGTYEFEEVPQALTKLRAGRTKGKIVVHIAKE